MPKADPVTADHRDLPRRICARPSASKHLEQALCKPSQSLRPLFRTRRRGIPPGAQLRLDSARRDKRHLHSRKRGKSRRNRKRRGAAGANADVRARPVVCDALAQGRHAHRACGIAGSIGALPVPPLGDHQSAVVGDVDAVVMLARRIDRRSHDTPHVRCNTTRAASGRPPRTTRSSSAANVRQPCDPDSRGDLSGFMIRLLGSSIVPGRHPMTAHLARQKHQDQRDPQEEKENPETG